MEHHYDIGGSRGEKLYDIFLDKQHRLYFGRYLCRRWNRGKTHNDQLTTFKVVYMREDTLPNGKTSTPKKVEIWHHDCFK